jgi:hypothetical protein
MQHQREETVAPPEKYAKIHRGDYPSKMSAGKRKQPLKPKRTGKVSSIPQVDRMIHQTIMNLAPKRSESREDRIRVLHLLKSSGEQYKELAKDFCSKSSIPKLDQDDFEKTWNEASAKESISNPITTSTLFQWIREDPDSFSNSNASPSLRSMLESNYPFEKLKRTYNGALMDREITQELIRDLQDCVAKIVDGSQYYVRFASNLFQTMDYNEFSKMLSGFKIQRVMDGNKDKYSELDMFTWIHKEMDPYIAYAYKKFRPEVGHFRDEEGNYVFNPFMGFQSKPIEYKAISENGVDMKDLFCEDSSIHDPTTILGFIYMVMANENREVYEYLLDWMHWVRFHPETPSGVALVFISDNGAGKNTFLEEFFGQLVIGAHHSLTTEGTKRITSDFNCMLENKLYVAVDEFRGDERSMNAIKKLVTGNELELNQKYKDLKRCKNYGNYVFLTNDERPFEKLNQNQRRFLIIRMNDRFSGTLNGEFWECWRRTNLVQEIANGFTHFLSKRTPSQNIRKWPITSHFEQTVMKEGNHMDVYAPALEFLTGEEFFHTYSDGIAYPEALLNQCNSILFERAYKNRNDKHDSLSFTIMTQQSLRQLCLNQLGWKTVKNTTTFYQRPRMLCETGGQVDGKESIGVKSIDQSNDLSMLRL